MKPRACRNVMHEPRGGQGSCWVNAALQSIFTPLQCKAALSQLWANKSDADRAPLLRRALDKQLGRKSDQPRDVSISDRLAATFAALHTEPLTQPCAPYLCTDKYYKHRRDDAAELLGHALGDASCAISFSSLFDGYAVQTMTCSSSACKHSRVKQHPDNFKMLHLPIVAVQDGAAHPLHTVQDALDNYLQPELVDYSWEPCTRCGSTKFWKEDAVSIAPNVLVLCLKRWADPENPLLHPVQVTDSITCQGVQYDLRSVVAHLGNSAHSGHYVTVAKHATAHGTWWLYDDECRKEAKPEQRTTLCKYNHREMKRYVVVYEKGT